jgi:hypothetical protein
MDHKEIEQKDIIEKYALHKLTEAEENAFEEHLLYCKKCRQALVEMENIIYSIQKSAQKGINLNYSENIKSDLKMGKKRIDKNYLILYPVAAAILVILITLLAVYYAMDTYYSDKIKDVKISDGSIQKTDSVKEQKPEGHKISEKGYSDVRKEQENQLFTDAYKKSPMLENAIANRFRSEDFEVISPKKSKKLNQGQNIIFIWEGKKYRILNLVLLNNKKDIIFEKMITSSYTFENDLKQGLYYWQLETEEESIYIDKFYIR